MCGDARHKCNSVDKTIELQLQIQIGVCYYAVSGLVAIEVGVVCPQVEALEMIINGSFDIIFMDINMPRLNGYETTTIIRKKLGLKIPILALTHCDSEEDIKMCKMVGMNDHLKKPLNEAELSHTLIRWRKDKFVPINK